MTSEGVEVFDGRTEAEVDIEHMRMWAVYVVVNGIEVAAGRLVPIATIAFRRQGRL